MKKHFDDLSGRAFWTPKFDHFPRYFLNSRQPFQLCRKSAADLAKVRMVKLEDPTTAHPALRSPLHRKQSLQRCSSENGIRFRR